MSAKLVNAALNGGSGVQINQGNGGGVFVHNESGGVTTNLAPGAVFFADPTNVRVDLSTTFDVSPNSRSFTFLAQLLVQSVLDFGDPSPRVEGGRVDFGNTAHLSIDLPVGYSYTSSSGVFLTGIAAPVPEPGTEWLLLAGLFPLIARSLARKRGISRGGRVS